LAERLGQKHFTVLNRIKKYNEAASKAGRCIIGNYAATYVDRQNKTRPQYLLTQVGVVKLAHTLGISEEITESLLEVIDNLNTHQTKLIEERMKLLEEAANPEALVLMKNKYGSSFSKETPKEKKWVLVREWDDEHRKFTKRKALAQDLTDLALWESVVEKCQLELEGKQAALRLRERYMNVLREWHESGCSGARPKPSSVGVNSKYDVFF
jgi:hypothetical protein